jgi:hypothetical protein
LAPKCLISGNAGLRRTDVLRGCGAAVDFDFLPYPGLATHLHRHHCLAALRVDKPGADLGYSFNEI